MGSWEDTFRDPLIPTSTVRSRRLDHSDALTRPALGKYTAIRSVQYVTRGSRRLGNERAPGTLGVCTGVWVQDLSGVYGFVTSSVRDLGLFHLAV
jgi:hypothetical protein